MPSYHFGANYDPDLQERAARIIMRRDTGQGRGEAANALGCQPGAARQGRLDFAIRLTLNSIPMVAYTPEEMEVLNTALWSVDDEGFAVPPNSA